MNGTLAGRRIVITGAGGGVGRGIALACAWEGAVVVVASPHENGVDTVKLIRDRGGEAEWARCDVTVAGDVDDAVALMVNRWGALDAMVHNATSRRSSEPARLEEVDAELWDDHAN